jgi:hypothetical protein
VLAAALAAAACVFAGHTHACACATSQGAHGVHAPSPTSGFTLSAGHTRHSSPARYLPGAHAHVPLAVGAKPLAHTEQLEMLLPPATSDVARNGHAVHAAAPAGANEPAAHAAQALAPAAAKLPAAQAPQALAPAVAKLPAAHALQALAPAAA